MKRVFILISFMCGMAFSQSVFEMPLISEINILPADSLDTVYYSYRIPTDSFVFVKDGNAYSADYRLAVEVRDSSSKYFTRQINEKKINADNFDETVSNGSSEEGLFKFKLKIGTYFFTPLLTDLNSNHEYKLHSLKVKCRKLQEGNFISPIVVNQTENNHYNIFPLTNFAGDVPFSEEKYDFIIPCTDTAIHKINITLINNLDTISIGEVAKSFVSAISIGIKDGNLFVENNKGLNPTRNFLVSGFSQKLLEGKLKIIVAGEGGGKLEKTFKKKVIWFDKPSSLRNPEKAIRFLAVVNNKNTVDSLLSGSSENYEQNLFAYWKRFDPTKNSAYNPLMAEYYKRVDYAEKHYYTISRRQKYLTDMSKVYIKYGKPVAIKRAYNQYGKIIETWVYKNPPNVFDFIDPEGTGNFILVKRNE